MSWENKIRKESSFYTKRKLRKLLDILNSDMEPTSKVAQAQGFIESMLRRINCALGRHHKG